MRYFLHIAYNGSNYRGWQRQPSAISVQQVLEEKLSEMLGQNIVCVGCGRTDAEVHASQYFLHIDADEILKYDPVERINRILPDDIVVYDWLEMPSQAHTQYDATSRTYEYIINGLPNPFLNKLSSYYPLKSLNIEKMQQVVSLLTTYKDYRAFCKSPDIYKHTLCQVSEAKFWVDDSREKAIFKITSNRFLRGMIRLIVGNLVLVGKERMTIQQFEEHLKSGVAPKYYTAAYPQGLYLSKVRYPYLDLDTKSVM